MQAASVQQTTLGSAVEIAGIGMHTGAESRVILNPAPPGFGIQFVTGAGGIPARAEFVAGTRRCTSLASGEAQMDTVEHLLSALAGLVVDNVEIRADGPELPILDGSAIGWVNAIIEAGIVEVPQPVCFREIDRPLVLSDGDSWLIARPAANFSITCATQFDHPLLGTEIKIFDGRSDTYVREIAPARTFGFIEEVESLLAAGLARGGNMNNALVIYPDRFSSEQRVQQECISHKILDLIGDLSLVGGRLLANVTAIRPSHQINTRFAAMLACSAEPRG